MRWITKRGFWVIFSDSGVIFHTLQFFLFKPLKKAKMRRRKNSKIIFSVSWRSRKTQKKTFVHQRTFFDQIRLLKNGSFKNKIF